MGVDMRRIIAGILGLILITGGLAGQTGPKKTFRNAETALTGQNERSGVTAPTLIRALGITLEQSSQGIVISEVYTTMPAYEAGLCRGDILLAVDQTPITSLDQAMDMTRNIPTAYVMVDVQRRDMRMSRRVEVADGQAQTMGFARDGQVVSISFVNLRAEALQQLQSSLQALLRESIEVLVVDLRNSPQGTLPEVQAAARALEGFVKTQSAQSQSVRLLVLRSDAINSPTGPLAMMLAEACDAAIVRPSSAVFMQRESGRTSNRDDGPTLQTASLSANRDAMQAPVHWNIADFRSRFPFPDQRAMKHPMMISSSGLASIVWGINGSAWEALNIARALI